MKDNNILITEMIRYYAGDPKRIQHFIKVYTFAKMIGEKEKASCRGAVYTGDGGNRT